MMILTRRNFTQGDGGDRFNIWLLSSGSDGRTSMSLLFSLGANGTRKRPEIKKNDIVLVADVNLPRGEWPLGRVTDLIASSDGLVRTVQVQIRGKDMTRPVSRLCLLDHHTV